MAVHFFLRTRHHGEGCVPRQAIHVAGIPFRREHRDSSHKRSDSSRDRNRYSPVQARTGNVVKGRCVVSKVVSFSFCLFRPKIACQAPQTLPTTQNPTTTHLSRSLPFGIFLSQTHIIELRNKSTQPCGEETTAQVQTHPNESKTLDNKVPPGDTPKIAPAMSRKERPEDECPPYPPPSTTSWATAQPSNTSAQPSPPADSPTPLSSPAPA